jgi:Mn2+/Fe2+ NRAMP family transporter
MAKRKYKKKSGKGSKGGDSKSAGANADVPEEQGPMDAPTDILGILRRIGPGLILAGSIVGSGELIATTATGAQAGFSLLWLILIGCVIKVFVQMELGRYAMTTGKTTLVALNEVPGPNFELHIGNTSAKGNWITWFWLLMFCASLGQLGGIIGGVGQAVSISIPLTAEGRAYNTALAAQVQLKVLDYELKQAKDAKKIATLTDKRAEAKIIADKYQAKVDAQGAYQLANAELAKLRAATVYDRKSDLAQKLLVQIDILEPEVNKLEKLHKKLGSPPQSLDDRYWAVIIGALSIILLVSGRYGFIELFSTLMVGLFTLITIGNLFALQGYDAWAVQSHEFFGGLGFGFPERSASMTLAGKSPLITALATFGIIGVGASELVAYPYWCLEKGYAKWTGPQDKSDAWLNRARGWIRVMKWDAWLSMGLYTFSTAAFYLLGAAILNRTGLSASGTEMIRTLSEMYAPVFGSSAQLLFLFGAFAVLYSTFFVANAAKARMATDVIDAFGIAKLPDESRRKWIKIFSGIFPAACVIIYLVYPKPVFLILLSGVMQALLLPMLGFAALYFRYTRCDKRLRPGKVWDTLLWISFVAFLVVGLYLTWAKLFA